MSIWAQYSFQVRDSDDISAHVQTSRNTEDHWVGFAEGESREFSNFLIVGATVAEAQAIADTINAAIEGAKARANAGGDQVALQTAAE